ncbi:MAG: Rne/Rng family ribonuclease [Alphaproteobacteria bacterium]|nr:Rne/Rng family ribonuclease [Alphaproteobacteria bacterium]
MTNKRLLIDATHAEETRVIIADDNRIHEFDISATSKTQNKGNIYLAKVTRVEPSLQAAFVEYGGDRQGFLPFSEIHPDYYQIPVEDRQKLIEEVAAEQAAEETNDTNDDDDSEDNNNRRDRGPRGRRGRRRGGRNRRPQDDQSEIGAVEDKGELSEEDIANTYLQEPIAANPAEKSDIVEDLLEKVHESVSGDDKKDTKNNTANGNNGDEDDDDDDVENVTSGSDDKADVEALADDDEFTRRRKASFLRRYKIQEVIKRNQVMLVQVIKEERGNKGASLSTYISLAGRYCVLMPNSPKTGGISRKISSSEDRKRLKAISEEIRSSNGMSAIIRTAGIDRTRAEIKRDYDYLLKLWNQIRELTISSTAPALVYEEADIVKRSLRDLYSSDIKEVIVAGEHAYKRSKEFMKLMMPSHAARIKYHNELTPIFYAYDAEDQLLRMHEPQVKLESGGSIVINPTEALVSIDVNSGRSTTERNVEETALKTNLEAAQEIARQVRLRDLAGLVVIDFIDMFDYKNRRAVERQLKDALKSDRAKIQLGRISAFGLLEMSRQRLRPSLAETNTHSCAYCEGRGFVLTPDAQGIQLLRYLEKEASTQDYAHMKLKVQPAIAMYLLNTMRTRLSELEKTHNLQVTIEVGENFLSATSFILERYTAEGQKTEINGMDGIPASGKRNRPRKRKRERTPHPNAKNNNDNTHNQDKDEAAAENQKTDQANKPAATHDDDGNEKPRRRRRGGRRRGGRNRDDRSQQNENNNPNAQQHDAEQGNQENSPKPTPSEKTEDNSSNVEQNAPAVAEAKPKRQPRKKAVNSKVDADNTVKNDTAEGDAPKPARKRPGRPKKAVAENNDVTAANTDEKPVAAKKPATRKPAAKKPAANKAPKATDNTQEVKAKTPPAKEPKQESATVVAAKTAAPQPAHKSFEPSSGKTAAASNEDKNNARKGWWRRIVE